MAVTLPTITIQDDAVAEQILNTFRGGKDPATGEDLEPQDVYRLWLRNNLIEYVSRMRADAKVMARREKEENDLILERQKLQNSIPK